MRASPARAARAEGNAVVVGLKHYDILPLLATAARVEVTSTALAALLSVDLKVGEAQDINLRTYMREHIIVVHKLVFVDTKSDNLTEQLLGFQHEQSQQRLLNRIGLGTLEETRETGISTKGGAIIISEATQPIDDSKEPEQVGDIEAVPGDSSGTSGQKGKGQGQMQGESREPEECGPELTTPALEVTIDLKASTQKTSTQKWQAKNERRRATRQSHRDEQREFESILADFGNTVNPPLNLGNHCSPGPRSSDGTAGCAVAGGSISSGDKSASQGLDLTGVDVQDITTEYDENEKPDLIGIDGFGFGFDDGGLACDGFRFIIMVTVSVIILTTLFFRPRG